MSDVLDEALAALREDGSRLDDALAASSRRAIVLEATHRKRRRVQLVRVVLPLAAVLAATTAWAGATGKLPRVFTDVAAYFSSPPPATTGTTSSRAVPPPPADPLHDQGPAVPVESLPSVAIASNARILAVPIHDEAGSMSPEEAEYRVAHEAHFVDRDWAAALAGWDAYLAKYPAGRFAPEARYNRAIALVRLGRKDEARTALAPFANGELGGYRQSEARALLDAMK